MATMHVLFLNSWYPSRIHPTNGDFIQRHAEAVATIHLVTAIHVVTDPHAQRIEWEEHTKNNVRTLIAYVPRHLLLKPYLFFKAYRSLLNKAGPWDIVHLNRLYPAGIMALYVHKTKGTPYIASEHWTGYLPTHPTGPTLWEKWWVRHIARHAACLCPVSRHLAHHMQGLGMANDYHIVPNVVYTEVFYPPAEPRSGPFRILHASTLNDRHKNISGMLRGIGRFMRQYADTELILIGPSPERYGALLRQQGMDHRTTLLEHMPQHELAQWMRRASVFVLFSRIENQPCVIPEAFACGLPVISSDVGGVAEYFPDNFGLRIPSEDEAALSDALTALYKGQHAIAPPLEMYQYVERHFSPKAIARAFDRVYKKALGLL